MEMKVTPNFCAVFIHNFPLIMEDLQVLCVQDERYLKVGRHYDGTLASLVDSGEVKIGGGQAETVSGGREETPKETATREAISETGVQILNGRLVWKRKKVDARKGEIHYQYFFLATEVSGLPSLDAAPREVVETNPRDGSVEKLFCYWLPLREFARRLYRGQYWAFGAILAELAKDEKRGRDFCMTFEDLLREFPAPRSED
jgi:8-oxo-dGTP pyrophosphatase MutT (NUDIX family)